MTAAPARGRLDPRAAAAPSSWAAGLHHRRHAAAGGPAPRPAGDSLFREGQLPDPADAPVNDEDEDEDRVELTHYFLRLAPWIVRPASPSARAGTMMAAIRTKFKVALERSRFPKCDWTVVGITEAYLLTAPLQQLADTPAPPPPNEAGGCWKELPETLAKKKAIHRCFMWCVLAHCPGSRGLPGSSGQTPQAARLLLPMRSIETG